MELPTFLTSNCNTKCYQSAWTCTASNQLNKSLERNKEPRNNSTYLYQGEFPVPRTCWEKEESHQKINIGELHI